LHTLRMEGLRFIYPLSSTFPSVVAGISNIKMSVYEIFRQFVRPSVCPSESAERFLLKIYILSPSRSTISSALYAQNGWR
jgi:hypothetical protein